MCYRLGVKVKNDSIKDCIKLGSIFKIILCHMSIFSSIFSHRQAFESEPVFPYVTTTVPWLCQKEWDELSFSTVCHPFLITLMSTWQHYYYTGQLLPLEKIWTSASLSKSFSSSICQPLSSLLIFSFVSYSTQHSVSLIHSIRGIQIQILYFKRRQCTLINISITDSNCTWFS